MAQQWDARDKTFIITGGASGLGAEYVKVFLSLGARVVAFLEIVENVGTALARTLNKDYNGKAVFIKCDVSKEEDITNAFETVLSTFKQIDVIVNNAGVISDSPALWRTACDVNWQGLVSFTLKGIKHMRKDEGGAGGTIINISSTAALTPSPFLPIYNGSNIAVLHFSQTLSMEPFYEYTNIRVLTMCFGPTDTPLLQNVDVRCYDPKLGQTLFNTDVANATRYQKVETAVKALVTMYEHGSPGTVWLSVDDKPVKDITPVITRVFKELDSTMSPTQSKTEIQQRHGNVLKL